MTTRTTFSSRHVEDILSHYALGDLVDFAPFTHGSVQTNLYLQTTHQRCVLRYYEQHRTIRSVLFEVNLLRYLKHKRFPCPAPLPARHGRYVGTHHAKPYVLFEFIDGQHVLQPTAQHHHHVIKTAAQLHVLTRTYRPTYKADRWNYSVALCRALAEQTAMTVGTETARDKLHWHSNELAQLQLPTALPKGICHADFHFSNVLFVGDTLMALLDFDDANYTFLVFDLVGLIEARAWPFGSASLDFAEAKQVVAHYMSYRPLNKLEKRHLFDVYKLSILLDCVWYFARGDAQDFYEKRKIDYLNAVGRAGFYQALFGDT